MLFSAGSVVFDIGAHHGRQFTQYLTEGRAKRVIAVEPVLQNYLQLLLTAKPYGAALIPVHAAVSNVEGISRIYPGDSDTALSTLDPEQWLTIYPELKFRECEFVPTVTLDTLIRTFGPPDYVKIDTEGVEELVLQGMSTAVAHTISFEVHTATIPATVRSLHKLSALGYTHASYIEDEALVTYQSSMSLPACIDALQNNQPRWGNIIVRR